MMMEALREEDAGELDRRASLRLIVPPKSSYAQYVRERVTSFAGSHGVARPDTDDFVSAVNEAFANAVEHARSDRKIEITCRFISDAQLIATVIDSGIGFEGRDQSGPEIRLPEPLAERGRGFAIMRQCTDYVAVRSRPGNGTAVILTRFVRNRHLSAVPHRPGGG